MAVAITKTDAATNTSGSTTYTFTNQALGGTSADQYAVAITARAAGARSISSVTIDGVSAVVRASSNNSAGGNTSIAAIYTAPATGDATGSVVVTFNNSMLRCGITVYRISGARTPAADSDTSTSNDPSVALDVPANGGAIAASFSAANTTATWAGLTEDTDTAFGNNAYSSSNAVFASAQTGLTVTCDWGTNTSPAFAAASWGPPLILAADAGTFSLAGQAATLRYLKGISAAQGAFTLQGRAAALKVAHKLAAAHGSYALAGQDAAFIKGILLVAAPGTSSLSGQAAGLRVGYRLDAVAGSYSLIGQDVQLFKGFQFLAEQGAFTLTGQAAIVGRSFSLPASHGVFGLAGQAAALSKAKRLDTSMAAYTLDGFDLQFFRGKVLIASVGNFTLNGQDAFLDLRRFARPPRLSGSISRAATLKSSIAKVVRLT